MPPANAAKKGYWIGHIDVTDPEGYKAYTVADMEPFGKFGGHFLVRGGVREVMEGKFRSRTVVLEFPSHEAALACYRSDDYQAAKKLRDGRAEADFVVLAGYDGGSPNLSPAAAPRPRSGGPMTAPHGEGATPARVRRTSPSRVRYTRRHRRQLRWLRQIRICDW